MISHCPRCDYSLEGLDTDHPCPECGLSIDADSECWRMRVQPAIVAKLLLHALIVAWTLVQVFKFMSTSPPLSTAFFMAALALIVWNVKRFANVGRLIRGGALTAITPEGLHVRLLAQPTTLIDWTRITGTRVHPGRWRPLVVVTHHDAKGGVKYIRLYGMFLRHEDAERFAQLVNDRSEHQRR